MKHSLAYLVVYVLVAAAGLSCFPSVTDSSELATSEITCTFSVERVDDIIKAVAHFTIGPLVGRGNRPVVLTGGDEIAVNGVLLYPTAPAHSAHQPYATELDVADVYTFTFTRPVRGTYTSTVTLPAEVSILLPEEDAVASRNADLDVQWVDNGGESISLLVEHELTRWIEREFIGGYVCLYLRDDVAEDLWGGVPDSGTYTLPAGGIQSARDIYNATRCECPDELPALLTLTRSATGDLDPALMGAINATAWDAVHFASAP
ncbi:MAG TPA: hypothetical protein ENN80_12100 [Candidatus Hydrogenedentes bacterium]|nr:hypothetical protein [Candidatus Hydrogenedentota bacterium]